MKLVQGNHTLFPVGMSGHLGHPNTSWGLVFGPQKGCQKHRTSGGMTGCIGLRSQGMFTFFRAFVSILSSTKPWKQPLLISSTFEPSFGDEISRFFQVTLIPESGGYLHPFAKLRLEPPQPQMVTWKQLLYRYNHQNSKCRLSKPFPKICCYERSVSQNQGPQYLHLFSFHHLELTSHYDVLPGGYFSKFQTYKKIIMAIKRKWRGKNPSNNKNK